MINQLFNNKLMNEKNTSLSPTNSSPRKIGKNIVCCNGSIIAGIQDQVVIVILMTLVYFITFVLWCYFIGFYFGYYMYIIGLPFYFIMLYNYLACYFVEPGIIPRYHMAHLVKSNSSVVGNEEQIKVKSKSKSNSNSNNSGSDEGMKNNNLDENDIYKDNDDISNSSNNSGKKVIYMFSNVQDDPILSGVS